MSNITSSLDNRAVPAGRLSLGSALKRALVGGGLAVAGNLLVYALARYALRLELVMPPTPVMPDPAPLNIIAVILATLIPAVGAGLVYWLLARFVKRGRVVFLAVSAVFLLLSFAGPFTLPAELATQLTLNLMHLVAGAAIVGALTR